MDNTKNKGFQQPRQSGAGQPQPGNIGGSGNSTAITGGASSEGGSFLGEIFSSNGLSSSGSESGSGTVLKPELPSGGGAITGFGGQFQADGFTGSGSVSFGGLSYNTGAGNGPFGFGFGAASQGGFSRRLSRGAPIYNDDVDQFVMGGAVLLPKLDDKGQPTILYGKFTDITVENRVWKQAQTTTDINDPYKIRVYQPRMEGGFSKIQYWKWNTSDNHGNYPTSFWRVLGADNSIHLFGVSELARVSNPDDHSKVFSWLSEESLDSQGHSQLTLYKQEDEENININTKVAQEKAHRQTAQKYLSEIHSGHDTPIPEPLSFQIVADYTPKWHHLTVYDYGQYNIDTTNTNPYQAQNTWTAREDPFSNYSPGFEIRTHRLCHNILTFLQFVELGENPVLHQVTSFKYQQSPIATLLMASQEIGYYFHGDHYTRKFGPPVEMEYSEFQPTGHSYRPLLEKESNQPFPSVGAAMGFLFVDLRGEAIDGLLYSDGSNYHYFQTDWDSVNGSDQKPIYYTRIINNLRLPWNSLRHDSSHFLMDVQGNGKLDYVVQYEGVSGYYELQEEGWGNFVSLPSYSTESFQPQSKMVNVCGSGRADCLIVTQDKVRYYQNNGTEGFSPGVDVASTLPANIESSEDTLFLFTAIAGDGVSHLVKVTHESLVYYPNYTFGIFGDPIEMENFPKLTYEQFKINRVFFADIDGTGTPDMILVSVEGINLYRNQSGNSFSDAISIPLPDGVEYNNADQILFADILGTGLPNLIYSQTHPAPRQWAYDFSGGVKPYLMTTHHNNIGAHSVTTYKSSTHFYLEDQANGYKWLTRAPFSTWVVSSMEAVDAISGSVLTEEYRYRDSYYDGVEREFRGFGLVQHRDTQEFKSSENPRLDSPPSLSKAWFHTGNPDQQAITDQYQSGASGKATQYFQGDSNARYLNVITVTDENDEAIDNEEMNREASIFMKGTPLHSELYALDRSTHPEFPNPDTEYPYTTENENATLRLIQLKGNNEYASFLKLPGETLSYHYERNPDDPQMAYRAILVFDEYGHPVQDCSLIYPRRDGNSDPNDVGQEQKKLRCLSSVNRVYNLSNAQEIISNSLDVSYLLGIPYDSQSYIINNLSSLISGVNTGNGELYSYTQLKKILSYNDPKTEIPFLKQEQDINKTGASYNLLSRERNYYLYPLSDDSAELKSLRPQINSIGLKRTGTRGFILPDYKETAVFNQADLYDILKTFYPRENTFKTLMTQGHYIEDGQYWWAVSGYYTYGSSSQFYLPSSHSDFLPEDSTKSKEANGTGYTTFFEYDPHHLMIIKATDPMGNVTLASEIDYQFLSPRVVTDLNANKAEVLFDELGRVIATSHYGGEMEINTDNLDKITKSYNSDVGFNSLFGPGIRNNPYVVLENEEMQVVLDQPFSYLQNAASYLFYAPFSWMGTVSLEDYQKVPSLASQTTQLQNWQNALELYGLINGEGALFYRFHKLLDASGNISDFLSRSGNVSQELGVLLQEFSSAQQAGILSTLKAVKIHQPVHVLVLTAKDYPNETNAVLTKQDYRAAIPTIDGDALNQWWSELLSNTLIHPANENKENPGKAPDTFYFKFRNMIQTSSAVSQLETALEAVSPQLKTAFDGFGGQKSEVFSLLWSAIEKRIGQMVNYSDGFGRALQNKIKAEDQTDCFFYEDGEMKRNVNGELVSNQWLTQGVTVYNNKGEVVRQYDPFFINTVDFIDKEALYEVGTSPTNYYDALGRVTQIVTQKGFLLYHHWNAWSQTVYDSNDTLMISPYYQANEANIFDPDNAKPPEKDDPYYQYYDFNMQDTDRNALKKAMLLSWTPTREVTDNRGLAICSVALNIAQYTKKSMTESPLNYSDKQAEALFLDLTMETTDSNGNIVKPKYLQRQESYEMQNKYNTDGELIDVVELPVTQGDLTLYFPIREVVNQVTFSETSEKMYDLGQYYLLQSAKIISILFDHKISDEPIHQNELYSAFVTAFEVSPFDEEECENLWNRLVKYKLLNDDGTVSQDNVTIPTLKYVDKSFAKDNNDIVNYMVRLWAGGDVFETRLTYDPIGRPLTLVDPRLTDENNNPQDPNVAHTNYANMTYHYPGSLGAVVRTQSCDAGSSWKLADALGRPYWNMDARRVSTSITYDTLRRPATVAVSLTGDTPEESWGPITVSRIQYGESMFDGSLEEAQRWNYRGKPLQNFTQGVWASVSSGFNISGLPLGGITRLTLAYKPDTDTYSVPMPLVAVTALSTKNPSTPPADADDLLSATVYPVFARYDAEGEIIYSVDPAGNVHTSIFHESGGIRRLRINDVNYIDNVEYNAKKQQLSSEYYNADNEMVVKTYYSYDRMNYRLTQIYSTTLKNDVSRVNEYERIERKIGEEDHTRQNLLYTLDPMGNVAEVTGYYQGPYEENNMLQLFNASGEYTYDAMYRLIAASGYEDPTVSDLFQEFVTAVGKANNTNVIDDAIQSIASVVSDQVDFFITSSKLLSTYKNAWDTTNYGSFDKACTTIHDAQMRLYNILTNPNFTLQKQYLDKAKEYVTVFSLLYKYITSSADVVSQPVRQFVDDFKNYFPAGQASQDENATSYYHSALNILEK